MDTEMSFQMFKYMTIAQNKELIKQIAKDFKLSESILLERYLKPEYYLPVVQKNDRQHPRHSTSS